MKMKSFKVDYINSRRDARDLKLFVINVICIVKDYIERVPWLMRMNFLYKS